MRLATCLLFAGIITAFGALRAAAQFVPVSQTRTVSAQVSGDDAYYDGPGLISDTPISGSESHSAPGFDHFASSASASSAYVSGAAGQDSTIGATLVTASGSAAGGLSASPPGYLQHRWSVGAGGTSSFSFTFDVPAPTPILLSGLVHGEGTGPFFGSTDVTLSRGTDTIAGFRVTDDLYYVPVNLDVPVNYSGTLSAGRYTISGRAIDGGTVPTSNTSTSFRFTLQAVPEPASLVAMLVAAPLLLRAGRPARR